MQLAIFSDIHTEFGPWPIPDLSGVDTVILAGDIGASLRDVGQVLSDLRHHYPDLHIIMVLGNHEFYKGVALNSRGPYHEVAQRYGAVLLDNSSAQIGDVLFFGGTLWTNIAMSPMAPFAAQEMNDFRRIRWVYPNERYAVLTTTNVSAEHRITATFLKDAMIRYHNRPLVIVTHHAPSERSAEIRGHLTDFYCNRLDAEIEKNPPILWVHGHVHHNLRYTIGGCTVICNPRGYVGYKLNQGFLPGGARVYV